jgi:hypothetical protein
MPAKKGSAPWNKGLKTPDSVKEKIKEALLGNPKVTGKAATKEKEEERKRKISETMKRNKRGGYREKGGRGKKGRYKGIWCDSSWELAWVIYHLDHNIKFERNQERFYYEWEGETHYYIPDFRINEEFIEVKGYMTEQARAKRDQFPRKLTILNKKEMRPIFDYVISKYGNNFISKYE